MKFHVLVSVALSIILCAATPVEKPTSGISVTASFNWVSGGSTIEPNETVGTGWFQVSEEVSGCNYFTVYYSTVFIPDPFAESYELEQVPLNPIFKFPNDDGEASVFVTAVCKHEGKPHGEDTFTARFNVESE